MCVCRVSRAGYYLKALTFFVDFLSTNFVKEKGLSSVFLPPVNAHMDKSQCIDSVRYFDIAGQLLDLASEL